MQRGTIKKGQQSACLLLAGSSLYVQSGKIHVFAAPQFLEGVAWQNEEILHAGMAYIVQRDGWIQLQALEASELLIQQVVAKRWIPSLKLAWRSLFAVRHRV